VLCSATLRVLANPEGYSQSSVSIDDYSRSWQMTRESQSTDLYFTAAEIDRVSPGASGAFTIRPGFPRKSCWGTW
jgi:hypothetical protein